MGSEILNWRHFSLVSVSNLRKNSWRNASTTTPHRSGMIDWGLCLMERKSSLFLLRASLLRQSSSMENIININITPTAACSDKDRSRAMASRQVLCCVRKSPQKRVEWVDIPTRNLKSIPLESWRWGGRRWRWRAYRMPTTTTSSLRNTRRSLTEWKAIHFGAVIRDTQTSGCCEVEEIEVLLCCGSAAVDWNCEIRRRDGTNLYTNVHAWCCWLCDE